MTGLEGCGKSRLYWDSNPNRPARSDSLYGLQTTFYAKTAAVFIVILICTSAQLFLLHKVIT